MLKVCQININSFHNYYNRNALEAFVIANKIDIICLSETWSDVNKKCSLAGFNFFEDYRRYGYGGAAIAFRKDLKANKLNFAGKGEFVAAEFFVGRKKLTIVSGYVARSVSLRDFEDDVANLIDLANNTKDCLICGDFNAKHSMWGNTISNSKGNIL